MTPGSGPRLEKSALAAGRRALALHSRWVPGIAGTLMRTVDYVCIFVRASGDRLRAAERLVLALPQLLEEALQEVDLRHQSESELLGVFVRLRAEGLARAKRDRLVFWTARAGGRALAVETMSADNRVRVGTYLARPTQARSGVRPAALFDVSGQFFTELGAHPERRRSAVERPQLVMDAGGPGWDGVRWSASEGRLFVAAPITPPAGDEVPLLLRVPGDPRPMEARATVVDVRPPSAARPGAPAGYALQLDGPPARLLEALTLAAQNGGEDSRTAPRFQVNAPVKVIHATAPAAPAPRALIEYATDRELEADYLENLSQGGAFVRTSSPLPVGAPLELELKLPNGAELRTRAAVVFANANGMGVQFHLAPDAEAMLGNAIAHISARPRRALVVDDDETARRMMADALRERGFEVVTSPNASDGLSTLSDELLALDLLVTDMMMPGMNGEDLVRLIRKTGGEVDLAIVCVTGQLGGDGLEQRLERAGADAVLDKALGPELIAQAADAVLERKRLVAQPG